MLKHLRIIIPLVLTTLSSVACQVPLPGRCPPVKIVENFDLERFMGTWYEHAKYPFINEILQKCQQTVYEIDGNDSVSVVNTGLFVIINKLTSTSGTAKVIAPGKLVVAFQNQTTDTLNYFILGTDYNEWAVVHSCRDVTHLSHVELLWILTRQRAPTAEVITAAKEVIKNNNLSEIFLIESIQTNCTELMETAEDEI